jgi:hypothetical protein
MDRGDVDMLDPDRLVQPLPSGKPGSAGLGTQDEQRHLDPGRIVRPVKRPFGSRARSVEDAEAAGERPAHQGRVIGTTLSVGGAGGRWNGRVSGSGIAVYHLQYEPCVPGS